MDESERIQKLEAELAMLRKAALHADSILSLIVWRGHVSNWGDFGMCTREEAEKAYQKLRAAYESRTLK